MSQWINDLYSNQRYLAVREKLLPLIEGKNVLVTGGTGTIGSEIVRQLIPCNPRILRIFSRDEYKQSQLRYHLKDHQCIRCLLGDIRDATRLNRAMEGVHVVFHAAALKRIESTEYDPLEAIKTNVMGTQNVITCTLENPVTDRVVSISTDKAVNVTSTMGATKLLAERLITWASFYRREPHKTLCSVRLGNVLDSRGSVIPFWREQIREGGPLTLSDPKMRRFFMSIPNAVNLILRATACATGGEIYLIRMKSVRINDLAEVMIEELAPKYGHSPKDIEVKIKGAGAGEKFDEDLLSSHELERTFIVDDEMAVIVPTHRMDEFTSQKLFHLEGYSSSTHTISKEELREYLKREGVI